MTIFGRRHSKLTGSDVGTIVWQDVVDTAARLALTVTSDKVGRVVRQLDDDSLWVLVDHAVPTYIEITAVGVAAVTSVFGEVGDVTEADANFTNADVGLGNVENLKVNLVATTDPVAGDDSDDGYAVGSMWVNTSTDAVFIASDVGVGAANWVEVSGGGGIGVWGFITGTLSAQADLQAELDAKSDTGHAHAATDVTSGVLADAHVQESNVTQHEGAIDHDALGNITAEDHIDWTIDQGGTNIHSGNYASGTGGATDTVTGSLGITNTGDDTNAVLTPTYGAAADTIAEGDDTRIVNSAIHATADGSDHTDVATNTLKVTNADHTGEVTGDAALTITANAVTLAKMATGTPGGIIAYDTTTGDAVDIGVGTQDQVVTSNVSGVVTWEDQTGGGGSAIEVQDDGSPLTTDVTLLNFAGAVVVTEPTPDEITITVTPGSAPVASVFGDVGVVIAEASQYDASLIDNDSGVTGAFVDDALDQLDTDVGSAQSDATQALSDAAAAQSDATSAKTKTDYLSPLTGTIDMDQMDIDVGNNNAKVTYDDAATVATNVGKLANVATTISSVGADLIEDATVVDQRATLGLGSAAVEEAGTTIGDLVPLVNKGGNPALPAVDGSNLTGIDVGVPITVIDETTELTTDLVQLTFAGTGVEATEPGADGEILVTVTSGAPGVIDITDGTTTVSAADKLTFDGTAFDVTDEGNDDALVDPVFGTSTGEFAEGDHTHDTLANIASGVILGRDTVGSGLSEELTPTEARTLIDVTLGNIGAGTHAQLEQAVGDSGTIFATLQAGQIAGLTEKAAPIAADVLLLEDSAASDAKKYAEVGSLPFVLDSEVDADIKTLDLPANTTITAFAQTFLDDAAQGDVQTTLDVDPAGTDNSTDVTFAGTPDYITIDVGTQVVTRNTIVATTDLSATGTKNSTTFLRGDDTWDVPPGGGGGTHKDSVRVATTADGALATAYENGDTVDGITLATGNRILLKDQTDATENGIYTVEATGAPTRASDLAAASSAAGMSVLIEVGTANASNYWHCTAVAGSDVVGTDNLPYELTGVPADDVTIEIDATNGLQIKDMTLATLSAKMSDQDIVGDLDTRLGAGNNNALGQWEWKSGGNPTTNPTASYFTSNGTSTKTSATSLQFSGTTALGVSNVDSLFETLRIGDRVVLNLASDPTSDAVVYTIDGQPEDKAGWWNVPVGADSIDGSATFSGTNYSVQFVKGPCAITLLNQSFMVDLSNANIFYQPIIVAFTAGAAVEDPPVDPTDFASFFSYDTGTYTGTYGFGTTGPFAYNDQYSALGSGTEATAVGSAFIGAYSAGITMTSAGTLRKFSVSGTPIGGSITVTACPIKITSGGTGTLLNSSGIATALTDTNYTAGTITTANAGSFSAGDRILMMLKASTVTYEALVNISYEIELY